ncbi:MAG: replication-relaxation family protein, partial [Actinomycetota bacterium]|nr:replication-relaxation family protein [Actinomycetota bacterium]
MFFDSESRARARLVVLHDSLGVVSRFRPHAPGWGSAPFHYVLSKAGAGVVAAERDEDPVAAERRWSTGRVLALAGSRRLAHTVGVNGFYAGLVSAGRRSPDAEVVRWLTEFECARATGAVGPIPSSSLR